MKNLLDKPLDELAEEFLPYLAALALGVGLWLFFRTQPLPTKTDKLVEASINIFSILVGFIGAALAIVGAKRAQTSNTPVQRERVRLISPIFVLLGTEVSVP